MLDKKKAWVYDGYTLKDMALTSGTSVAPPTRLNNLENSPEAAKALEFEVRQRLEQLEPEISRRAIEGPKSPETGAEQKVHNEAYKAAFEEAYNRAIESGKEPREAEQVAHEQAAWADAELARKKLKSAEAVSKYDAGLQAVRQVEDSLERRKALIKLVESGT
mgnify:CR=1 FL=1